MDHWLAQITQPVESYTVCPRSLFRVKRLHGYFKMVHLIISIGIDYSPRIINSIEKYLSIKRQGIYSN
jgi:hypothetical protein